jgi:hypothetical protein
MVDSGRKTLSSLGSGWAGSDIYRLLCSESLIPDTLTLRGFLTHRWYACIYLPLASGESAYITDPWGVGIFVPPPKGRQYWSPLTLWLTPRLSRCAWHGMETSIGWHSQVCMICFFFFHCLNSCGSNSEGMWCQHRISDLAQKPAALKKKRWFLVGLATQPAWNFVSWKPHTKARLCLTSELG